MMFEASTVSNEPTYVVKCPYCTSHLLIDQDRDDPKAEDEVSCYFHGVIGTRQSVSHAAKNGNLELVSSDTVNGPSRRGLNNWGYFPQAGDATLLARAMFAESAQYPGVYPDIGWSIVNRIGAPGFPDTLEGVITQQNQYTSVGTPLWDAAGNPASLTGPNRISYNEALQTADEILGGQISDTTHGATHFFSGSAQAWFQRQINSGHLTPTIPEQQTSPFTFLK